MRPGDAPRLPAHLPRALVFDMDGLMLDTERIERHAWQQIARQQGRTISDAFYATLIGRRCSETDPLLSEQLGSPPQFAALKAQARALWREHLQDTSAIKPGLISLLDTLDRVGLRKAVATSTERAEALRRLGPLAQRFQFLVCGDEVREGKPAPEIYARAAALLCLPAADCLALEDSPAGVRAAHAAGMPVVVVSDLAPADPDVGYRCASLLDIEAWVRHLLDKRNSVER